MARETFGVMIVGAGPRGTSVLERILARLEEGAEPARDALTIPRYPLEITIVEPHEPGPGHVWATGQPRCYLMNTPALFPTVAPPRGTRTGFAAVPPRGAGTGPGLSFEEFRTSEGDGTALSPIEKAELKGLTPQSYPPRALYGRYLKHVFDSVHDRLELHPGVAAIRHLRTEARAVHRRRTGYDVELGGDFGTRAVDAVVLAVGHVPAHPNPRQLAAGERAAVVGLHYQGPNVPTDVDWSRYPPGEDVLVRGLGLNFFDAMISLSVGRGGEFVPTGGGPGQALAYRASGREPVLHPASRRGAPYRAKACIDGYLPDSVQLRHLTFDAVHVLAAEGAPGELEGKVGFNAHVWPLLHRDILRTYYATLVGNEPQLAPGGAGEFMLRLDAILDVPHRHGQEVWRTLARALVEELAPSAAWLDVPALGHPFAERGFTSQAAYQDAVLEFLEEDARSSARGENDALKMAIGAMNAGRTVVKRLVAEGLLDDTSRAEELRDWFEPLVEGLAGGPPLQRIEELAALARAGLVYFVGPDPVFSLEEEETGSRFTAASPWVDAEPATARYMLEAMMPANRVAQTASPLLEQLQADGLARPLAMVTREGEEILGTGFDVVGDPYRLVDAAGVPHRGIFPLGLQLSSVQWGTAIAAEAGADWQEGARTLADADAIAAEVIRLAEGD